MKVEHGLNIGEIFNPSKALWRMHRLSHMVTEDQIKEVETELRPVDAKTDTVIGELNDQWLKQFYVLIEMESGLRYRADQIGETAGDSLMGRGYQRAANEHMRNMTIMEGIFNQFLNIHVGLRLGSEPLELRKGWKIVKWKRKSS